MQAGSQAERAGEWRTRQSAFRSSALTEVGAVVLQRAEAMCSDGDYAGARTLLALELPLPMGLTLPLPKDVLFHRDICGVVVSRLSRDAIDVASRSRVCQEKDVMWCVSCCPEQ